MGKRKRARESDKNNEKENVSKEIETLPATVYSDEPPKKQTKWTNKERVLIFSSRGISFRARHLMIDLRTLMPHSKSESKMDRKDKLFVINEMCEMKNCNKCLFFEGKKKQDLYLWASNCPRGPSVKFLVENVHTMSELKMTGNCLKASRPLLSFDPTFDKEMHWSLLKELFIQTFSTPNHHPKSQPFFDHVFTFSILDNRIWFRNYQILEEDGSLVEIGPRFVLNPIRMFEGSFGGTTLYVNPHYISPNEHRRVLKAKVAQKYINRVHVKKSLETRNTGQSYILDPTDDVFVTIRPEEATGAAKNTFYRKAD
ncbi:hypothetical protein CHS0354_018346 [Potamilus streckersoni]|uniref:Ribosome biogenesis protein BRX1 homolog n=1 Tax=Potamilus streckersoni TaxID=2493646 RepID=A0AAE0VP60_9BIVA|nr:hypothetical protein CHS0354_018346 [Potamilus streckersoni]